MQPDSVTNPNNSRKIGLAQNGRENLIFNRKIRIPVG